MPLILAGAALVFVALGGAYYFSHQTSSPAPDQSAAITSGPTNSPKDSGARPEPAAISKPVGQELPPTIAPSAVSAPAPAVAASPEPQNARPRTTIAEAKQTEAPSSRRPAVPNLNMSSPSAPSSKLANLPDGSSADPLDLAPSTAPGAGSPGTFSARMGNQPAPPPVPNAASLVSTVATPAKLITSTRPNYPAGAKNSRVQGSVVISANIDEKGMVSAAQAISGPVALRQAGVDAVKQWKYSPSLVGGKPTPTQVIINLEFHLQ